MPAIEEDYHASWRRKGSLDERTVWCADIPLLADDKAIGRVRITGAPCNGSVCAWMGDLIVGLKPFEAHLLQIVSDLQEDPVTEDVSSDTPTAVRELVPTRR